ncbi:hypothetical protein CICLE_v10026665mg [Citrus x clementina]|uniref:Uncharacterized protein n=2 Tax=Citrus TaxID=2706 RepID=A0A067EB83_CITSI|nr:hypothetical protein CICLE_v10026665mg [Citrus x clementina]KDO52323.1 hypothetical protein CISIN_1g034038mg [Citrus sinensis]
MCKSLKLVKELNQLIPILQSNAEMGISRGNPLSTQNVMTSRQKGVAGLDPSDWRNQLSQESRRRIVNKMYVSFFLLPAIIHLLENLYIVFGISFMVLARISIKWQ